MSDPQWITVWCQGGPADDFRYETMIEPEPEIEIMPDPFNVGRFLRVVGDWPQATTYVRQPAVEQFGHERIYYPKNDA